MKCVEEEDEEAVYPAKKLIESNGLNCLTLHSATLPVKSVSQIAKAIYYMKVSANFAHKLSAPVLVVHSNVSRRLPEKLRKEFLAKIFRKFNPYAKRLSLQLALENLSYASRSFGKNLAEIEEIISIVDDGTMGITIDFGHAETTGQTLSLLEKYKNRLCNVHLSNRSHRPLNRETPNLSLFLKKLQEYGYNGPLTIELNSKCAIEEILETKTIIEKILSEKCSAGTDVEVESADGCVD